MRRRTSVRRAGTPRRRIALGRVRQVGEASWAIEIDRELKSPNKTLWGHWRLKQRERQEWEDALLQAAAGYAGVTTAAGLALLKRSLSLFVAGGVKERRIVQVVRQVPHHRRFIKDDDNLGFAVKPLYDAMKRVGLIYDDKREYLEIRPPVQVVSTDGAFHTVIDLGRAPATAAPISDASIVAGGLYV